MTQAFEPQSPASTPNIDTDELAKFADMAEGWWDPEGEFQPLHRMNPLRVNYINERVDFYEAKVLDIGCGGGILSEAIARRGATVTGIDMSTAPLNVARSHAKDNGLEIDYQEITAEAFAEEHAGRYDVVTCLEMLEHVPDPGSVVQACKDLVKPGGHVFFSTINRNPKAYALAIVGAEYVLKMLPRGTHDYEKFIRPSELAAWARQAGLTVEGTAGIIYNPISKRFKLSERDVSVNYIMHCQAGEV